MSQSSSPSCFRRRGLRGWVLPPVAGVAGVERVAAARGGGCGVVKKEFWRERREGVVGIEGVGWM